MTTASLYDGAGYVRLVETWGSDEQVIASARMSTDGAFRGWGPFCGACGTSKGTEEFCPNGCGRIEKPGDEKLLRYLWEHQHFTPFEMAGAIVEMQVPIFVMRQIQRHRAASFNELSARYTEMEETFWLPRPEDIRRQPPGKGQGGVVGDGADWSQRAQLAADMIESSSMASWGWYRRLIALGVAREQARAVLPMGTMTRCRMQCNLRMWTHFLGLRLDPHAQAETRAVADGIAGFLRVAFPRTMALFDEGLAV